MVVSSHTRSSMGCITTTEGRREALFSADGESSQYGSHHPLALEDELVAVPALAGEPGHATRQEVESDLLRAVPGCEAIRHFLPLHRPRSRSNLDLEPEAAQVHGELDLVGDGAFRAHRPGVPLALAGPGADEPLLGFELVGGLGHLSGRPASAA